MSRLFQAVDADCCRTANNDWDEKLRLWQEEARRLAPFEYVDGDLSGTSHQHLCSFSLLSSKAVSKMISQIERKYRPRLSGSTILWPLEVQNAFKEDFFESWKKSFISEFIPELVSKRATSLANLRFRIYLRSR